MPPVAMLCKCDVMWLSPWDPGPTPSVGHVTGDMKRRESNETLLYIVRSSPARCTWSHEVCRASNIAFAYMASMTATPHTALGHMKYANIALAYMASVTTREVDWKSIYCPESLVLRDCFGISHAFVLHSMNSTKDQRVS